MSGVPPVTPAFIRARYEVSTRDYLQETTFNPSVAYRRTKNSNLAAAFTCLKNVSHDLKNQTQPSSTICHLYIQFSFVVQYLLLIKTACYWTAYSSGILSSSGVFDLGFFASSPSRSMAYHNLSRCLSICTLKTSSANGTTTGGVLVLCV